MPLSSRHAEEGIRVTELMWEGKYKDGKRVAPVRLLLAEAQREPRRQRRLVHRWNHRVVGKAAPCQPLRRRGGIEIAVQLGVLSRRQRVPRIAHPRRSPAHCIHLRRADQIAHQPLIAPRCDPARVSRAPYRRQRRLGAPVLTLARCQQHRRLIQQRLSKWYDSHHLPLCAIGVFASRPPFAVRALLASPRKRGLIPHSGGTLAGAAPVPCAGTYELCEERQIIRQPPLLLSLACPFVLSQHPHPSPSA